MEFNDMSCLNCISCSSNTKESECISCNNGHNMCRDCFENQIHSQISSESIGEFTNNSCKIVCKFCTGEKAVFADKKVIANISDDLCEMLIKVREDIIMKKTEIECEKRHEQNMKKSKIDQHRNFICENILTLHCSNKRCNAAIFDFTGCFAIECASCKGNMCGWCLGDFSPDAHEHVKICKHSLNKGSVFGTFDQFNLTHTKKRAIGVKKYLESIFLEDEKEEVKKAIKKDLTDLHINVMETEVAVTTTAAVAAVAAADDVPAPIIEQNHNIFERLLHGFPFPENQRHDMRENRHEYDFAQELEQVLEQDRPQRERQLQQDLNKIYHNFDMYEIDKITHNLTYYKMDEYFNNKSKINYDSWY